MDHTESFCDTLKFLFFTGLIPQEFPKVLIISTFSPNTYFSKLYIFVRVLSSAFVSLPFSPFFLHTTDYTRVKVSTERNQLNLEVFSTLGPMLFSVFKLKLTISCTVLTMLLFSRGMYLEFLSFHAAINANECKYF